MRIQVEWVNPKQLKPAGFNPPKRVEAKSLTKLINSIRKFGFLVPVITANNYEIIDGHRRTAAALKLNLSEIPIIRLPLSLQEGWSYLNDPTMKIDDKSWVYVLTPTTGFDVQNAPSEIKRKYKQITDLIPDGITMLAERNMSFGVWAILGMVRRFVGIDAKDKQGSAMILRWLIEHEMQTTARRAIELDLIKPSDLLRAIRTNAPLRKHESYTVEG